MRGTRRIAPATLLTAVLVATLIATPGTGSASIRGRSASMQTLAPGVTLTRITDPDGPYKVYVLTIDPSKPSTVDLAMPGTRVGSYAKPSQIGAARGALAAVNGDFSVNPGRPLHTWAADGAVTSSGLQDGPSFAISQDKSQAFIQNRAVAMAGRILGRGPSFSISGTNSRSPVGGKITAFTPYGSLWVRPPADACSVRLKRPGRLHWGIDRVGVVRDWIVSRSVCADRPLAVGPGTVVLSSRRTGPGSRILHGMKPGENVRLDWSFGWADVMDSVGGMPLLVSNGRALPPSGCHDYFCSLNPRTGIGITADGKILMVVVDGRRNDSEGMTLQGFARYMVSLGAVSALNLDGGGGSAMWIAGQGVINHPSDFSGERPVTNAVLVLPGADRGEGTPLPFSEAASVGRMSGFGHGRIGARTSEFQDRQAMNASANDPGSTGGLMDALSGGDL